MAAADLPLGRPPTVAVAGRSPRGLAWRRLRRRPGALVAAVVLLALVVGAVVGPALAPADESLQGAANPLLITDALNTPAPPSAEHPFGTADAGRDELRLLFRGGRVSLLIGLAVGLITAIVGTAVGALAGALGGRVDWLLMRLTDVFLAVPTLPLQLALIALALRANGPVGRFLGDLDPAVRLIAVISAVSWMVMARLVRTQVRGLMGREFVEAAQALGASRLRVVVRHVLPNCTDVIVVNATLTVGVAVLTESALSFLSFGDECSWGTLVLSAVRQSVGTPSQVWWLIDGPGLFIALTVASVTTFGEALRDALDPHGRR